VDNLVDPFIVYRAWNKVKKYMVRSVYPVPGVTLREILFNPDILYEKMSYDPREWVIMLFSWREDKENTEIYSGDLIYDTATKKEYEVKIKDGSFKAVSTDSEVCLDYLPEVRVAGCVVGNILVA
jgi:hypothetical protein